MKLPACAVLVLLLSVVACTGFGAGSRSTIPYRTLQPGAHAGGLYLYRPPDSATYYQRFSIAFDGRDLGQLSVGGYIYVQAGPGRHRIEARPEAAPDSPRHKTVERTYDVELTRGANLIIRFPVQAGILFRFGPGYEEELLRMREDRVFFFRAQPED